MEKYNSLDQLNNASVMKGQAVDLDKNQRNHQPNLNPTGSSWKRLLLLLTIVGPGLMVMLADTDAGSVITAAQSGAQWGYSMILPQLVLIPILYVVQEITVRLGAVTHTGHGELIRKHFGLGWALLSVITLFVACIGALITEFAGIAGVSQIFGIPVWISIVAVTILLIGIGLSGSYRRVERIGLAVGLLELFFIVAAILAKPDPSQIAHGLTNLPIMQGNYLFLLAANVGAVIMPWMVFYQQGAIVDKCLRVGQVKVERWDTLVGAILTQLIMLAVVVVTAAAIHQNHPDASLNSIQDVSTALQPVVGSVIAKVLFGFGMLGAAFLAALVVSIAGAWGVGEALELNHSLNAPFGKAKLFYTIFTLSHVVGAVVVLSGLPLVSLTVDVEVMNAILLPIVLGFLLVLEQVALPKEQRMHGLYKITAWFLCGVVMLFGLYTAVQAIINAFSGQG